MRSSHSQDDYYVAARGEDLLGFSMLRGFDEGYEIPSFGIFVDHESHGQGIGRRSDCVDDRAGPSCEAARLCA